MMLEDRASGRGTGFTSTVGIIHDNNGQLKPLDRMSGGFLKK